MHVFELIMDSICGYVLIVSGSKEESLPRRRKQVSDLNNTVHPTTTTRPLLPYNCLYGMQRPKLYGLVQFAWRILYCYAEAAAYSMTCFSNLSTCLSLMASCHLITLACSCIWKPNILGLKRSALTAAFAPPVAAPVCCVPLNPGWSFAPLPAPPPAVLLVLPDLSLAACPEAAAAELFAKPIEAEFAPPGTDLGTMS